MANDEKKDALPSSHSSFQRFERVMRALVQVPKKEIEQMAKPQRQRRERKRASK
jgi:hypothetical protein